MVKEYAGPSGALRVLNGVSLVIGPGESVAIMGPSGCGKSTLLAILGALDPPTSGKVELDGRDPYSLPEPELARFRNRSVGFVFQDHCLLPQCTVLENVLVPTLVAEPGPDYLARAKSLLEHVGLGPRLDHLPSQLSGGEKQRVSIARALVMEPKLLLCDEPTGNLDRKSADSAAQLLMDLHAERRTILVLVTHSERLASHAAKLYELMDGKLVAVAGRG